jgi:hypothetical protein
VCTIPKLWERKSLKKPTFCKKKKEGNLFFSKLIKPNNDNSIRGRKCPVFPHLAGQAVQREFHGLACSHHETLAVTSSAFSSVEGLNVHI